MPDVPEYEAPAVESVSDVAAPLIGVLHSVTNPQWNDEDVPS